MVTGGCWGLQGLQKGYKRLQGATRVTGGYRELEGVTGGYIELHEVIRVYMGLQRVLRGCMG